MIRSRLAYLCARLDERSRAVTEIAQALQLAPDSNATRETAVLTYEALGRREDALTLLSGSPAEVLTNAARFPELTELQKDIRFQKLMSSQRNRD